MTATMLLEYRDRPFWPEFQARHWVPRVPTVIRRPFRSGPLSDAMVLGAMRAFAAELGKKTTRFRHMASLGDKAPTRRSLAAVLGAEVDSMDALERGIERRFPEREFGLMINQLQSLDRELWRAAISFLQDGFATLDFPIAKTTIDLFHGNYAASFLGLHKDTQDIFAFVTRGKKTILAWPFQYFIDRVEGMSAAARFFQVQVPVDYRRYRKDALVLEAEAGDIIYWPSDYWHIAEGKRGEFSTMLSLGLFRPDAIDPARAEELGRFRERLLRRGGSPLESGDMTRVNRQGGERRLEWMTGFSFQFPGPLVPRGRAKGRIRKLPESLLLWTLDGKALSVACNGHLTRLQGSEATLRLLSRLARGGVVTVDADTARLGAGRVRLVDWLVRVGAVATEPARR